MKVLFAVNNENISEAIIKMYQKDYKEIITYKNVYYFNAILKELQKDKTYDRIIISEDLEPFANNNYDAIDKFIFEKLDKITDEATNTGDEIPIILICTDRRAQSEQMLVKLFGIGIYNAILGDDRSVEEVCSLLKNPRSKKEAKNYYKIDSGDVDYQAESEDTVSEEELQNILAHYKRLGRDESRYVESFNNIAAQYNDTQLRLIAKILPLNVKAVLEANSPKYQSVMTFRDVNYNQYKKNNEEKKKNGLNIGFIKTNKNKLNKPVVIPSAIDTENVRKIAKRKEEEVIVPKIEKIKPKEEAFEDLFETVDQAEDIDINENIEETIENTNNDIKVDVAEPIYEQPKRGRGRPKKIVDPTVEIKPKRGRGRPRKVIDQDEIEGQSKIEEKEVDLFNLDDEEIIAPQVEEKPSKKVAMVGTIKPKPKQSTGLFDLADDDDEDENEYQEYEEETLESKTRKIENEGTVLPGFEEDDEDDEDENSVLSEFDDDSDEKIEELNSYNTKKYEPKISRPQTKYEPPSLNRTNYIPKTASSYRKEETTTNVPYNRINNYGNSSLDNLLTGDKKIITFVGTSKNGTSFIVNNLAQLFSEMGIKTAILDTTQNKNAFYIYTKNEETLRKVAYGSIDNLRSGRPEGIEVNRNLTVYTSLPGEGNGLEDYENVLSTLAQNYSVILIDSDFETNHGYFDKSQEIYLVQSMDILTIQPLTAFLRDLKSEGILSPDKLRIVINKELNVKMLSSKAIVGGLAYYNAPSMSFMTELFNKDTIRYYSIPFDIDVYSKYLEGIVECEISINKYSKEFISYLKNLANVVYPLMNNKTNTGYSGNNTFSANTNNTLNMMKNRY